MRKCSHIFVDDVKGCTSSETTLSECAFLRRKPDEELRVFNALKKTYHCFSESRVNYSEALCV